MSAAPSPPSRAAKIAAVLAVVLVLAIAKALGVFEQVREPARLARSLVELGGWGYFAFVLTYALVQPFGIPGTVFVVAAPLIWPWPTAYAVSMTGTMAASVVGFSFSRFVAREWIASRIPTRFRKYDEALAHRAFATVFTLRLIFWMPPLLHAFFGVSKVRASTHFWGSLAGYAVPLFLLSFFGRRVFDLVKQVPPTAFAAVLAVVILGAVAWFVRARRAS